MNDDNEKFQKISFLKKIVKFTTKKMIVLKIMIMMMTVVEVC